MADGAGPGADGVTERPVDEVRHQGAWRAYLSVLTALVILAVLLPAAVTDEAWRVLLLKTFLIAALSFLPGWMYLQFIGLKGPSLYDEFVLNLHRLRIDALANLPKPPPGCPTYAAWRAALPPDARPDRNIYLQKFEAVYGESAVPPSRRRLEDDDSRRGRRGLTAEVRRERFGPVLFATAVLTVGWAAVLQPEVYAPLSFLRPLELSGVPEVPLEAVGAGWLGAYVFVVQSLARRYYQQDLKSRAYLGAVLRLVVVVAFVVALHPLWALLPGGTEVELLVAFLLGFFPELGLRLLAHRVAVALRRSVSTGETAYPLRELDGCSLYAQARLLEEGVEDMQNLASADLVDLLLDTRVPVARLVDWVDQAHLYLRVDGADTARAGREHPAEDGAGAAAPAVDERALLRRYGIRTASDLCDVVEGRAAPGGAPASADVTAGVLRLLNAPDDGLPSRVEGIYRSLANEPNLWHVRQWKRRAWLEDQAGAPTHAAPGAADDPAADDPTLDLRAVELPGQPGASAAAEAAPVAEPQAAEPLTR